MTVLPIVERELRVAARRRGFYRGRAVAAGIALLVGAVTYWANRFEAPSELGVILFVALSTLALFFSLLAGAVFTADSLSAEHREGTVGLLFLTDLKGHDVILGKLVAAAVPAVLSLLAVLPILAVAVLFGGVAGTALWQMGVALLSALGFTLVLGIAVSVWFHDARKALVTTVLLTALLTFGPWLAKSWSSRGLIPGLNRSIYLSPLSPFVDAVAVAVGPLVGTGVPPKATLALYWPSLGGLALLSALLLTLASAALQRSWHEQASVWRAWWRKRLGGLPRKDIGKRRALRAALLARNPYLWLNLRQPRRTMAVWSFLAVLAMVAVYGHLEWGRRWTQEGGGVVLSLVAHFGVRCGLILAVVHQLSEDRRSGALELLLVTPLGGRALVAGQMQAMRRLYGGPVLAILAADVLSAALRAGDFETDRLLETAFTLGRVAMLIADGVALAWLGTWTALGCGGALRAAGAALFRIWVVPWGVLVTLLVGAKFTGWDAHLSDGAVLSAWLVVGLVNNAYWVLLARRRMAGRLRAVAEGGESVRGRLRRWLLLR